MYSSIHYWDQNYKLFGAFTPEKNLPQSPERELCFVLYLLGNKIRETQMFNNILPVSTVFHSCGWLCPQKHSEEGKVSLHNTPYWLVPAEEKSSTGAQCFMLWDHNVIFSCRSCRKTPGLLSLCSNCSMHRQENRVHPEIQQEVYASFSSGLAPPSTT